MADHRIGTVFVELDLDPSRYMKGQQTLLKDAKTTSLSIEENFKKLGVKSSAEMDLMRQKITNSYNMIANSSRATANDIIRAEEAKNAKLKALNEQQFGQQISFIDKVKANWIAAAAGVAAAMALVGTGKEYMELGAKVMQTEESFKIMADVAGESADKIIEAMKRASRGTIDDSDIMQKAVKGMVSGLSGEDMVQIMEAARVAARIAGEDVKTAYENITDAIATGMPKGLKKYLLITKEEMSLVNQALKAGVEDVNLFTIAMANAQIQQAKFGDLSENAAEAIQRNRAAIQDLTETMSVGWVKAIGGVIQSYRELANVMSGGYFFKESGMNEFMRTKTVRESSYDTTGMQFSEEEINAAKQSRITAAEASKKGTIDRIKAAVEAKKSEDALGEAILQWKQRIDALGPALDPFAQKVRDIQDNADKLTLKWGKQAWIIEGLAKGKALIQLDEMMKRVVTDLSDLEFHSGLMEGPFTKEDINIAREYIEIMKNFDDEYATATQNIRNEMDSYYAMRGMGFGEGFKNQMNEYVQDMKTAGEYGADAFNSSHASIRDSFADLFSDINKGELKTFEEYMVSFVQRIATSWSNMCADMLANWVMTGNLMKGGSGNDSSGGLVGLGLSLFSGLFGGGEASAPGSSYGGSYGLETNFHTGGIVGAEGRATFADRSIFANAPRFHGGNEYPAILQKGEGVFTKGQMAALAPKGKNTGGGGDVYITNITANDPKSFRDLLKRDQAAITQIVSKNLKGNRGLKNDIRNTVR